MTLIQLMTLLSLGVTVINKMAALSSANNLWSFHIFSCRKFLFFVSHFQFNLSEGWQLFSSWAKVQSAAETETQSAFEPLPAGCTQHNRLQAAHNTTKSHTPSRTVLCQMRLAQRYCWRWVFWDAGSCQLVNSHRCFEGWYCRHLQG